MPDIMIKPDALSSGTLRKTISAVKKAYDAAAKAEKEGSYYHSWTWGGVTHYLFTNESYGNVIGAASLLKDALDRLEELSRIMQSGPDGFKDIDRSFKISIRSWRRSGKHDSVLWTASGGSGTAEETSVNKPHNGKTETIINPYSEGVKKGEIRWVDQTGSEENNRANGWGNNSYLSGGQCNSACESMALSYMGIDRSPESMVPSDYDDIGGLEVANYGTQSKKWIAPDGSTIVIDNHSYCDMEDINNRVENFSNDGNRGDTGPVMIRYEYGDGSGGHWLLITGRNPDGSYNVVGPATESEKGTTVTIDEYGNISGSGISKGGGKVERYAQYSREN